MSYPVESSLHSANSYSRPPPLQQLTSELDRLLASGGPSTSAIENFIRQVLLTAGRSVDREETALAFSQRTVLHLFKTNIQLGRELYVLLLQKLCETWPKVAKEAIDWLLYAEDEVCLVLDQLVKEFS